MMLSCMFVVVSLTLIIPINGLPNLEDVFGRLWQQKQSTRQETKSQKSRVKRQTPPIGDGSQIPWVATADQ